MIVSGRSNGRGKRGQVHLTGVNLIWTCPLCPFPVRGIEAGDSARGVVGPGVADQRDRIGVIRSCCLRVSQALQAAVGSIGAGRIGHRLSCIQIGKAVDLTDLSDLVVSGVDPFGSHGGTARHALLSDQNQLPQQSRSGCA
jgi:hypothetical protein